MTLLDNFLGLFQNYRKLKQQQTALSATLTEAILFQLSFQGLPCLILKCRNESTETNLNRIVWFEMGVIVLSVAAVPRLNYGYILVLIKKWP